MGWVAGVVLGGACAAVAGALVTDVIMLEPEIAAATNLPASTVSHVIEILVRHKLAVRDGCGVLPAAIPAEWLAALRGFVDVNG